jgi:hypothetical protein
MRSYFVSCHLVQSETVNATVADPDAPNLGIWVAGQEALGSRERIFSHLKHTGFYINSDNLALIALFHLRTDLSLVDLLASSCMIFFAVTWLSHDIPPPNFN